MKKVSQVIETINNAKKDMEFLPTGFKDIDIHLNGGFLRKELVILGGSTGSGKSFLAGQMLQTIAKKGFFTAYFSLEITNEMIVSRLIGQLSNLQPSLVMTSYLNENDEKKKQETEDKLISRSDFMDFYDDIYEIEEIEKKIAEKAITDKPYDFVVVDFIQNVFSKDRDEYSRLSYVSLQLQRIAKKYNCCILVLSQLSNSNSDGERLEYKGSGAIAMVADLGFFIDRGDKDLEVDKFRIILKKNRRGVGYVGFDYKFITPGGKIE
jgi:replicative DNA helicase